MPPPLPPPPVDDVTLAESKDMSDVPSKQPVASEDLVVLQIPKSQFDSVADGIQKLNDLIVGAKEKAEADIAGQDKALKNEEEAASDEEAAEKDAAMIAELEAMDRASRPR